MAHKPTLFLSYRRASSADLARYIRDRLVALGVDVFFDVENINAGRFAAIIEKEIIAREHFLVILTPSSLESEWVTREILTALANHRNIIPLMTQAFDFSKPLPQEIADLANYSGIPYDYQDPERAIERLKKAIGIRNRRASPLWIGMGIIALIALFALTFFLLFSHNSLTSAESASPTPTTIVTKIGSPTATNVLPTNTPSPTLTPSLTPTNTSLPALTATPTLTQTLLPSATALPTATATETVDVVGTIVAATNIANVQSTSAMATVFQYYAQTATETARTAPVFVSATPSISTVTPASSPFACTNGLPTRLHVEMSAIYNSGPDQFRVAIRTGPGKDYDVVTIYTPDQYPVLDVIGGPTCETRNGAGWMWWQVRDKNTGVSGWAIESIGTAYYLAPTS